MAITYIVEFTATDYTNGHRYYRYREPFGSLELAESHKAMLMRQVVAEEAYNNHRMTDRAFELWRARREDKGEYVWFSDGCHNIKSYDPETHPKIYRVEKTLVQ